MAQPFVPGPAPLWVGLGSSEAPIFLGFTERGVDLDVNPQYAPYLTDLGGGVMTDACYQGALAQISFDLTRWNEETFALMADHAGIVPGSVRGTDLPGEIGTLMAFENAAFPVWCPFPYVAKAAYASMPAGYRFPKCYIERESLPERGAKPAKIRLVMQCLRHLLMTSATQNQFGAGRFTLYDHDMTAINGLLPD